LEHERRKAATDLEAAIQKTSVRVATRTAASVSDILGRQFADTVAELQSMKKVAAASATEVHAIWEDTQSGKQKRKTLINYLNARILQATGILDYGSSVGPPGSGGSPAQYFTEQALNWTTIVGAYLLGSLGQSYADRFDQARLASTPRTSLDPKSASRIEIQVRELEAKMDTLKQFVKELAAK
jgi:hypothetical protein